MDSTSLGSTFIRRAALQDNIRNRMLIYVFMYFNQVYLAPCFGGSIAWCPHGLLCGETRGIGIWEKALTGAGLGRG